MTTQPDPPLAALLTEPQARALSVGLRHVARALDQLDQLLDAAPQAGAHEIDFDIQGRTATALRTQLEQVRRDLGVLVALLEVTPQPQSARAVFAAQAASAWSTAEDLHPRKLRRYDAVDPRAKATLTPLVERLAQDLLALTPRDRETEGDSPAAARTGG